MVRCRCATSQNNGAYLVNSIWQNNYNVLSVRAGACVCVCERTSEDILINSINKIILKLCQFSTRNGWTVIWHTMRVARHMQYEAVCINVPAIQTETKPNQTNSRRFVSYEVEVIKFHTTWKCMLSSTETTTTSKNRNKCYILYA